MDLKLDETTVASLMALQSKRIFELEGDLTSAKDEADSNWRENCSLRDRICSVERELDRFHAGTFTNLSSKTEDQLRTENAKLQQTIRDLGSKLLACSEDAKAIKFRYHNGDLVGRKIQAIKEVRDATQCGLKEAKDYIEAPVSMTQDADPPRVAFDAWTGAKTPLNGY